MLAVVYGLKQYRQYLLGRHFVIHTDHSALQSMKRTPEPVGQQARWLDLIEQFDYEIQHRAGTSHENADGLSRRPRERDGSGINCKQCHKEPTAKEAAAYVVTNMEGTPLRQSSRLRPGLNPVKSRSDPVEPSPRPVKQNKSNKAKHDIERTLEEKEACWKP
jgi:hypothetical protein